MKKVLALTAVSFLFMTSAFSQESERTSTFSIGPSVGFGHAGVRGMGGTAQFKDSWNAGVIFNYSKWEHVGFAGDILLSTEGSHVINGSRDIELTLQYIRVPLKFAYFFRDSEEAFRPKITIGPSMGFLTEAHTDIEGEGTTTVTSSYNSFDIGLGASVGFNYKIGTNLWLNTDINYYTGFSEVAANQYNNNIGLKLGLAFGL